MSHTNANFCFLKGGAARSNFLSHWFSQAMVCIRIFRCVEHRSRSVVLTSDVVPMLGPVLTTVTISLFCTSSSNNTGAA